MGEVVFHNITYDPGMRSVEPGDFVAVGQGGADVGIIGSLNTLRYSSRGAVGYITNGWVRDTDELIL